MSQVDDLADELTNRLFEADPLRPSVLGLPGSHDRLPDLSEEAEARHRETCLDIAARAEALDVTGLHPEAVLTRDVVVQQARAAVDLLDAKLPEFAVSDAFTAPIQLLLITLPMIKLTDEVRATGFVARLAAIPSFVDAVIERQSRSRLIPPGFLVDAAIGYFDRLLASPVIEPLRLDVGSKALAAERDTALDTLVRPALARYRRFLAEDLKPRARPAEEPGLCWQPGGLMRYAGLIRAHTTTDRSAQELHDIGLTLITDLAGEFRSLGSRVFGTTELSEIFTLLRTDPGLRWSSGAELLAAARTAIERAEAAAPRWFRTTPAERCEVRPVPDTDADAGTIAYYVEPALDGSRPGIYYANTSQAGERFRHVSEAVAYHEAVPGHHFQLSLALGLELPLLRRIADVNSYVEGWGLYAERLADEMGLYSDDVARLGMLTQDAMRAGRLVVDTGLHALGWSRQQAVDYLRENTPMAPVEIEEEIDRYAGCPGQALSYMAGRLEIQRIRAAAERALGERFDVRDFHDVVLGHGILPLPVLDRVVSDWITSR
ncbi:hypothetical protein GCM10027445_68470 [Amycolatopsis endophytica]|uniref:Uncharacterized protein (DUF885 family) n=1 Tax=Amycolatopsis endophytica TaxID=860233 RepID=A0A853BDT9_9PSEU|nr:DUF885 domain-containing protein [Amycolatopsis endophytica]NYI92832.1 uncharacterized protein (DUF885 family) [Amycolatopsis endophytica]